MPAIDDDAGDEICQSVPDRSDRVDSRSHSDRQRQGVGIIKEKEEHDALPIEIERKVAEGEEQQPRLGRMSHECIVGSVARLGAAFGKYLRPAPALHLNGWWRRTQNLVADAIVETDPVDPLRFAMRIAVAQLNAPRGGSLLPDVFQRVLPGVILPIHAAGVPPADEADVQENRIVKWSGRVRRRAGW